MVEVIVKRDPLPGQVRGDWLLKIGRGRGGRNLSRHRTKSRALKKARKEASKRADDGDRVTLLAHDLEGRLKVVNKYNGGHKKDGGFFGF